MHIANIGLTGFPVPELYNIDYAQTEAAAKAVAENADLVLGVKVRMSENVIAKHGLEPLKRAIRACEIAGTGAKVMCHIGGVETPELMSQILDLLRAGDVLTHGYSGAPNIARQVHQHRAGRQAAAGRAGGQAARRGVRRRPRRRQLRLHRGGGGHGGRRRARHDLLRHPRVLRQHAGHAVSDLGDEQVPQHGAYAGAGGGDGHRLRPAKVINRAPKLGTLQVGAPADVSLLEVVEGPVEFVDTRNNKRQGKVHLKPAGTVLAGVPFGRPYQAPFAVR